MIEKCDGPQIIFQRSGKISLRFLHLPADEEGLRVGEGVGRVHDLFLQRRLGDRLELLLGGGVVVLGHGEAGKANLGLQRTRTRVEFFEIVVGGLGFREVVCLDVNVAEHRRGLLGPRSRHALEFIDYAAEQRQGFGVILGREGGERLVVFGGRIHPHFLDAGEGQAELVATAHLEFQRLPGRGHADDFTLLLLTRGGDDQILRQRRRTQQ